MSEWAYTVPMDVIFEDHHYIAVNKPAPLMTQAPAGVPSTISVERYEEYAPGADPELLELIQATADMEMAEITSFFGPVGEPATKAAAPKASPARKPAAKKTA